MSHHTAITWGKTPNIVWTARADVEAMWLLPGIASTLSSQTSHPTARSLPEAVLAEVRSAALQVGAARAVTASHPTVAETGDEEITILVHDDGWSIEYRS